MSDKIVTIADLIILGCALLRSSSPTLDMSIVQYSVSVIIDGVVPTEVRVRTLLGRLLGGVRAISACDGDPLGDGCTLDSWVSILSIISVACALSISIC